MSGPITVKNAVDTWVNQERPDHNFGQKARLWLRTAASHNKYGFLYFNKPWPSGATIINAKLRVFAADAWTGTTTLTVERPAAKWHVNRLTYNTMPGVTGASATLVTGASTVVGQMMEIDVTALVQSVANGSPWYGFRLRTSQGGDTSVHSAQAGTGANRPALIVTWSDAPDQPDGLRPAAGRVVATAKPILAWSFSDVSGDQTLGAVQVQIGTSEANVNAGITTFDSGTVAASEPQLDLSTTAYAGVASGGNVWWRSRNQDGAGLWSPWADAVNFGFTPAGVLTLTASVASLTDGSPTVSWTFTGAGIVQKAYQVAIALSTDPNNWIWDSGKITSTATSKTIPFGTIVDASASYIIRVRVWDTNPRESVPGVPVYVEAVTAAIAFAYDVATSPVTALAFVSDAILPIGHLTWTSAVAPDTFQIQRSDDNGVTWYFLDEKLPSEALVSGSNYKYDDMGARKYTTHTYRVMRVVANKMSGSNPVVNGSIQRVAPMLMRKDGSDLVCFLNPERDRQRFGVQSIFERMNGAPVLVTQRVGGQGGNVRGRFVDDTPSGYTAKQMKKSFLSMEGDSGQKMILCIANETLIVMAYNFNLDVVVDTSGVTYDASFSWIEVG